jgi:membrane-associated protease RseP (regulator of RpoE activity)
MLISFAGPLAGFVLAAFLIAALQAVGIPLNNQRTVPVLAGYGMTPFEPWNVYLLVTFLLQVNVYWGLVNLLPIYPLDGGQIARNLLEKFDVPDAVNKSLILSIVAAGGMVLVGLKYDQVYLAIMFGYLAYQSYVSMQQNRGNYPRSPW